MSEQRSQTGSTRMVRNAASSLAQTLISAALLFFLYREVLRVLGAEALGVWSVVLATAGTARLAELGLSGSAVKYVAAYSARGDDDRAARAAETTVVSMAVGGGVAATAMYMLLHPLLPLFVPDSGLQDAFLLLPYACISLWLSIAGLAAQSGLDGYHRFDIRNGILLAGQAFFVGLALVLMPSKGLIGLALAQIAQGALTLVASWIALRTVAPSLSVIPFRWDIALFREMLGYGVQYQVLGVLRLVYEPITKALMSAYGGLALAGFYEMASQYVLKVRALMVSAQQVMTPEVAARAELDPEKVESLYRTVNQLNWQLAVPAFAFVVSAAPVVSRLWIGDYTPVFFTFSALLSAGWLANTLSGPAFFLLLGTGQLRPLLYSHATTAVVNVIAGVGLGIAFGGPGVAAGWGIALAAGAAHLLFLMQRKRKLEFGLPSNLTRIGWGSVAVVVLSFATTRFYTQTPSVLLLLVPVGAGIVLTLLVWQVAGPGLLARTRRPREDPREDVKGHG